MCNWPIAQTMWEQNENWLTAFAAVSMYGGKILKLDNFWHFKKDEIKLDLSL